MNVAWLLRRTALAHPLRPAVSAGARVEADYRELARRAGVIARRLRESEILRPGDRVALAMTNHPAYIELVFALWQAGITAVPMNAKLHPREMVYILADSGATLCFTTPELTHAVDALRGELPDLRRVIDVTTVECDRLRAEGPALDIEAVAPEDVAWLFYTSGTTGRPKGVMITHRNLMVATLSYFAAVDSIAPDDCIVHAAPMSHGSGMYNVPHVLAGANQVIPESGHFDPAEIFALCGAWRGVTMFAAPTMVHRLVGEARARAPRLESAAPLITPQDCATESMRHSGSAAEPSGVPSSKYARRYHSPSHPSRSIAAFNALT